MSIPLSKTEIRRCIGERRRALSPAWRAAQSARIWDAMTALPAFANAKTVGVYLALSGEVDTADGINALMSAGRMVCVPALDPARGAYAMAPISPGSEYVRSRYGLREPVDPVWVDPASLDCVVVPGLAFDNAGRRVGHGGGHYDRMLAGSTALKIGVAFDFQVFEHVPAEGHDITMDWVITQTRTWMPKGI